MSTDIPACLHLSALHLFVFEALHDFGGSLDCRQLDADLIFIELHVALFDLVRGHNLLEHVGQLTGHIPGHLVSADDHTC